MRGDKVQSNFGLNENINGLKNQPVKNDYFISDVNGVQPIENIAQLKNQLSETRKINFLTTSFNQTIQLKGRPVPISSTLMKLNMYEKGLIYFPLLFFIPY